MANSKRFLSIVLAVLMVFSTMSCLGSVIASAAVTGTTGYEHNYDNWDKAFSETNNWDGIDSLSELTAKYGAWDQTSNPWIYIGIEVYEKNASDEWELTDHYVQPGQELLLRYYIKGDCYTGDGNTLHTQFDRSFFDIASYSATTSYTASYDTIAQDGLDNTGYPAAAKIGAVGGAVNPNNTYATMLSDVTTTMKSASLVVQYKNTTGKTSNTNTGVSQDVTKNWDIMTSALKTPNTVTKAGELDLAQDEYIFEVPIKVRSSTTNVNGTATTNYAGVADGAIGHLGIEEYLTAWHNGTKCPAFVTYTSNSSLGKSKATKATAGTEANLHTEDCNHTFIIGTPGASTDYTATFKSEGTTVATASGTTVTAPAAPTAPSGMTFGGWSDGSTTYQAGATITLTANTEFTAVWNTSGYTVKYMDGATEYTALAMTGASGSIQLAAAQSKDGYRFSGWSDGSNTYAAGTYYAVSTNTTFTAQWTKLYTATFTGDGIATTTAQYAAGETVTFPATGTRDGYTAKWTPASNVMPASDTTFTLSWVGNASSISFNTNGGSAVATITGNYGDAVTAPANPTKEGYEFAGWTLDGAAYTFSTMPATAITLDAQWTANKHSVTYADVQTFTDIDYGTAIPTVSNPTQEGYDFAGWVDADGKAPSDYSAMPDKDLVFTAQWTAKQYTIRFNKENGSLITEGTQTYGNALVCPDAPTVSGKTFSGWTGSDGSFIAADSISSAKVPAGNVTYTATYGTDTYYITYMLDGVQYGDRVPMIAGAVISDPTPTVASGKKFNGWESHSATMPAENITISGTTSYIDYTINYYLDTESEAYASYTTAHYGDAFPVPEDPSVPGYTFVDWDNDATTVTGSANVYAIFNALEYDVVYTYGLEGDGEETATVRYGDVLRADDFPNDDAAVEGYGLTWTYDGEAIRYPFAVPALPEGSTIEFVATYGAETKTLTYYIVYGEGDVRQDGAQETLAYGAAITLRDLPSVEGYNYSAWAQEDGTAAPTTMPASNVALYTTRTAIEYDDTWYDIDGTTILYTAKVAYGSPIPEKTLPTHDGYENLRWDGMKSTQEARNMSFYAKGTAGDVNYTVVIYTEQLDGTYTSATATRVAATGDTVALTAQDKSKTGYTVSTTQTSVLEAVVAGDGSTVLSVYLDLNRYNVNVTDDATTYQVVYKHGESLADITPAGKTGYSYDKCVWSKTAGGASIAKPATVTSDLYVTVNYSINSYDIVTNCDGATTTTKVVYGTAMPTIAPATKDGYEFKGWYTDSEYKTAYTAGGAMPAETVNLYGYFQAIEYTYTFNSNGTSQQVKGTVGQTYTVPTAADKTGYNFKAWSPVATGTFGVGNQTFEAVYTINSYTITFKNGDTTVKSFKVPYDTAKADIAAPADPTKVGYKFNGWDTIPDTMPANDVTVYATWTANTYSALFYANAGDAEAAATVADVTFGTTFTAAAALADTEYYTFGGWKLAGTSTVYAAGDTITMDAEGMSFVAVWNQNTDACYVKSVERVTTGYYQLGGADYKVTVAQPVNSLTISYTNAMGSAVTSTYSKPGYYLGNDSIISITAGENGSEIWVVNAVLAEMEGYKIYATLDNGTNDAENAYQFNVTYDVKDADKIATEFISAACDKTSMVRGETATWTVTTSTNVTWLEFTGTYTTAAGDTKNLTTYYKASNYTSGTGTVTVTDNGDVRTWVVPMALSYTASDLTVTETWNILYKVNGSTKWDEGMVDGTKYVSTIVIGRTADALNPAPSQEYAKYTLVSVAADKANAAVGETVTFTVVVTTDVTKVRIGFNYTVDGVAKAKTGTYQTTSTNVKSIADNGDGTATWTITYKVPSTAVGTTDFNVQVRGDAWGEAQSETIVVA